MMGAALWGLGIGFFSSIPAGPAGTLIFSSSLNSGMRAGISSAAGLFVAQVIYYSILYFGLASLLTEQSLLSHVLTLAGVTMLTIMGTRMVLAPRSLQATGSVASFRQTFTVAILNPAILFFALAMVSMYQELSSNYDPPLLILLLSSQIGTFLWFALLASLVAKYRDFLIGKFQTRINRCTGYLLILFSLYIGGNWLWGFIE